MALLQYKSFTKNGSLLDICSNVSGALGLEISISAENKVGGYEHLILVVLQMTNVTGAVHEWKKTYNHYMIAGKTYTFSTASNFVLPAGTYDIFWRVDTDALFSSLPLAPEYNSIPVVF